MNEARWSSGSCVHGDYLYTFGGHRNGGYINSIEKLQVKGELGPASRAWQLIPASQVPNYSPRTWTVACPLNSDEIVLLGGNKGVQPNDYFNDIQIYDVATDSCTSRIETGADFTFCCEGNGSIKVSNDRVVAGVTSLSGRRNHIIEYTKGSPAVKVLLDF